MFRLNASFEIFQKEIQKVVQEIPRVTNKSDDIIMHTENFREHYQSVHKLLGQC